MEGAAVCLLAVSQSIGVDKPAANSQPQEDAEARKARQSKGLGQRRREKMQHRCLTH